jgi:putative acetyltransferase
VDGASIENAEFRMKNEKNIILRRAVPEDLEELRKLYYDTVTTINAKDYDENQIRAWVGPWANSAKPVRGEGKTFSQKIVEQYFIVAIIDNVIAGFASLEDNGYLDFMYVHKDYQRCGVAKALLTELESYARKKGIKELDAIVSITAKGFFEKHGWKKIREDVVEIRGAMFTDNILVKTLE